MHHIPADTIALVMEDQKLMSFKFADCHRYPTIPRFRSMLAPLPHHEDSVFMQCVSLPLALRSLPVTPDRMKAFCASANADPYASMVNLLKDT